jgi:hypothetical protein
VCSQWEYPCVTCNAPSSIRLPVYCRELVDILTGPMPVSNPFLLLDLMEIFNSSNPIVEIFRYFQGSRFSPAQFEVIYAEFEASRASIMQIVGYMANFWTIEKTEAKYDSGMATSGISMMKSFIFAFIEVLQLIEVKGLVTCAKQFGRAYHSVYLMYLLSSVVTYSSLTATDEDPAKMKEIEETRNRNKTEIEQCVIACKEVMISVNAMLYSEEVLRSKNICRLYTVLIAHLVDRPHPASTRRPLARCCIYLQWVY